MCKRETACTKQTAHIVFVCLWMMGTCRLVGMHIQMRFVRLFCYYCVGEDSYDLCRGRSLNTRPDAIKRGRWSSCELFLETAAATQAFREFDCFAFFPLSFSFPISFHTAASTHCLLTYYSPSLQHTASIRFRHPASIRLRRNASSPPPYHPPASYLIFLVLSLFLCTYVLTRQLWRTSAITYLLPCILSNDDSLQSKFHVQYRI